MNVQKKRLILILVVVAICLGAIGTVVVVDLLKVNSYNLTLTNTNEDKELAATYIKNGLAQVPKPGPVPRPDVEPREYDDRALTYVMEQCQIEVLNIEPKNQQERYYAIEVSYTTIDVWNAYKANKDQLFEDAWLFCDESGRANGSEILLHLNKSVSDWVKEAEATSGTITVKLYDRGEGNDPFLYLDYETVNTLLGGVLKVHRDINNTEMITVNGEGVSIQSRNSLRNGIIECFGLTNYDDSEPQESTMLEDLWNEFYRNFLQDAQWSYLTRGLGNTMAITGLSLVLGVFIGFLTAILRCVHETTGKLWLLNEIAGVYVGLIRGTPLMVQLLVIYFVLLLPNGIEKFPAAVLCFGLNSGAYVSEIVRGGIMAVDKGQMEAGRSLGFGFAPTMFHVILPQAFKSCLPALCNEFITLFKETSVAFYIGVADLMQGGLKIRSITYSNFMPLIAVALIYLVIVLILTRLVGILERRLRRSER